MLINQPKNWESKDIVRLKPDKGCETVIIDQEK